MNNQTAQRIKNEQRLKNAIQTYLTDRSFKIMVDGFIAQFKGVKLDTDFMIDAVLFVETYIDGKIEDIHDVHMGKVMLKYINDSEFRSFSDRMIKLCETNNISPDFLFELVILINEMLCTGVTNVKNI